MINKPVSKTIFSLPLTTSKANQVFYATMCAGVFFVPMLLLIYHRFIEPQMKMNTREFFAVFSAIYLLFFIFSSARASRASKNLRKKLGNDLPRDATVVAPTAAKSGVAEIIELGQKYWFWQLVSSYFSGITFSWLGSLFILFIL